MKNPESPDSGGEPHIRPMPSLAQELGVLIKETQAVLNQRMDRALRPLGLTVPQYACLQSLRDAPGLSASELARRTFVSRQSFNVLLKGLESRGLVDRTGEPGPRRERAATITPAGTSTLAGAQAAVSSVAESMVAGLSAEDQSALRSGLARCRDALMP